MTPIFIGATRSFWLGIVPAVFVLADLLLALGSDTAAGPVSGLIAAAFGADPAHVEEILRGLAALAAIIVAHQRRGAARPYTIDPRATK